MNIFYFSAEVEPFAKSGGLGDVLGALPKAVAKQKDNNVYVVMPYYKDIIKLSYKAQMEYLGYFYTDVNWRHQYVGVYKLVRDNVNYIFWTTSIIFRDLCTALPTTSVLPTSARRRWTLLAGWA